MPTSNGWQQAYNGQAAVDMDSHLIVGGRLSQAKTIGHRENITADNGYYSTENVNAAAARGLRKAAGEWNLVQCAYNMKRMHALAG